MDSLHPAAHAIRPVRIVKGAIREYEATTFPGNPWGGCAMWIRRAELFSEKCDDTQILLDVLDANGDIIQDFPLTRRGFNYLRRCLKFKVVRESRKRRSGR